MSIKVLTPNVHKLLDFAAAAALIVAPFLLNLGADSAVALWLSVAGGVGLIGYSLLTDYLANGNKPLPFKLHLAFDFAAAIAFIVAPLLFGFTQVATYYYWVMAAGVIAVVLLSDTQARAA